MELLKLKIAFYFDTLVIRLRYIVSLILIPFPAVKDRVLSVLTTKEVDSINRLFSAMTEAERKRFNDAKGLGRAALVRMYKTKYGIE